MTLLGNSFNSDSADYLDVSLGPGGKSGHVDFIGNNAANFSDLNLGQAIAPVPDKISDKSLWLVRQGLDDFRRLGYADLVHNHPQLWWQ